LKLLFVPTHPDQAHSLTAWVPSVVTYNPSILLPIRNILCKYISVRLQNEKEFVPVWSQRLVNWYSSLLIEQVTFTTVICYYPAIVIEIIRNDCFLYCSTSFTFLHNNMNFCCKRIIRSNPFQLM